MAEMGAKQSTNVDNYSNPYPLDSKDGDDISSPVHVRITKRPSMPSDMDLQTDINPYRASKRRAYSESETVILDDRAKMRKQGSSSGSKKRPAFQEILLWKDNFNALISHHIGLELFRIFLHSEHSEESIQFWCACEEFRSCRFRMQTKAKRIYKTFIQVDSNCQVNLDYKERNQIEQLIKSPNRFMFDEAQHKVKYLMMNDSYPRFLKSSIYTNLEQRAITEN